MSLENQEEWNWHPNLPFQNNPIFYRPTNIKKIFEWYSVWFKTSEATIVVLFAVLTWFFFQPALEFCKTFRFDWISLMYLRNLTIIFMVAGGLHLYLYAFKRQGNEYKYNNKELAKNNKKFLFSNQVLDNMFWSVASGVTLWTIYETFFIWNYANENLVFMKFNESPIWFILLFIIITMWESIHFYLVHRFLHWKPLYKLAHSVHHRNVNTGPWSGISMHPLEHVIYFSSVFIHFFIPSHPIHFFFHMYLMTLNPLFGHTDFDRLIIKGKKIFHIGHFDHQLHHKYFDCNYGTAEVPIDDWVSSFHDGTEEAREKIRERRIKIHGKII